MDLKITLEMPFLQIFGTRLKNFFLKNKVFKKMLWILVFAVGALIVGKAQNIQEIGAVIAFLILFIPFMLIVSFFKSVDDYLDMRKGKLLLMTKEGKLYTAWDYDIKERTSDWIEKSEETDDKYILYVKELMVKNTDFKTVYIKKKKLTTEEQENLQIFFSQIINHK